MKFCVEKLFVFPVTSAAADKSILDKFSPTPGFKTLTQNNPIINEINDALKNQPNAFPPTLPTVLISPNFAIPGTNVLNTSTAIII